MISDMQSRLTGFLSMMSYGYCQLCVKADPSSLLGFEEDINGITATIEQLAHIATHEEPENEDKLEVYPLQASNLPYIMKGIKNIHPEFKQSLETYSNADKDDDSLESKYLRLTMPEVNDDRRDILNTAIDALDTECKLKFDGIKVKYMAKITKELINDDPKNLDEAKEEVDALAEQFSQMRQQLTDDKKKEVEEAYQRWLTKEGNKQAAKAQAIRHDAIGQSLRMD